MSIKVYDGKRLPSMSIQALHEWQRGLRNQVNRKAEELFAKELATYMVNLIHYACLHDADAVENFLRKEMKDASLNLSCSPYLLASSHLYSLSKEAMASSVRDVLKDRLDYRARLVVFPTRRYLHGITFGGMLLALFLTEQSVFRDLWEDYSGVREYGYWNNTDRPEKLKEWQWRDRARAWEKAFNGYSGGVLDNGLVYDLVPDVPLVSFEDVLAAVPSFESRAKALARSRLYHRLLREEWAKTEWDNSLTKSRMAAGFSTLLDISKRIEGYLNTEKGNVLFDEELAYVSSRIPAVIDKDVVLSSLSSFCQNDLWSGWSI